MQGRSAGTVDQPAATPRGGRRAPPAEPEFALAVQGMYFGGGVLPGDRIDVAGGWYYIERRMSYRGVDASV